MSNAVRISLAAYLSALDGDGKRVGAICRRAWGDTEMRRFLHDVVALAGTSASPKAVADLVRVLGFTRSQFRALDTDVVASCLLLADDARRAAQLISKADAFGKRDTPDDELARVRAALSTVPRYSEQELQFRIFCLMRFTGATMSAVLADFGSGGVALEEELLVQAARAATGVTTRAALKGELLEDMLDVALPNNERFRWALEIFDALAADYRDAPTEERLLEVAGVLRERLALLFPSVLEVRLQLVASELQRLLPNAAGPELRLSVLAAILRQAGERVSPRQLRETKRAGNRTTRGSRR